MASSSYKGKSSMFLCAQSPASGDSAGGEDGFICKFSNDGELLWATLFGGDNRDFVRDITVSNTGTIYCYGQTRADNFPLVQKVGYYYDDLFLLAGFATKCFVASFDENTEEDWVTYFGGKGDQLVGEMKLYDDKNLYISGTTGSGQSSPTTLENYPLRWSATDWKDVTLDNISDGFLARFNVDPFYTSLIDYKNANNVPLSVSIIPNPNRGSFRIDFSKSDNDVKTVEVFNSLGQRVYLDTSENLFIDVNLTQAVCGIYHVSVLTQNHRFSGSFIIE